MQPSFYQSFVFFSCKCSRLLIIFSLKVAGSLLQVSLSCRIWAVWWVMSPGGFSCVQSWCSSRSVSGPVILNVARTIIALICHQVLSVILPGTSTVNTTMSLYLREWTHLTVPESDLKPDYSALAQWSSIQCFTTSFFLYCFIIAVRCSSVFHFSFHITLAFIYG